MKAPKRPVSRRSFLKGTAMTAVALGLTRTSARSYGQIIGANEDIRLATIGCNDCGRAHINQFIPLKGVRMVGLCDVDSAVLDRAKGVATARLATANPTLYSDCRKVLDNKEIDAISVATPNHWHALLTVWGVQAGKDVYIEKPTCHNIWEGQQAVAARAKYDRIVQAGTQWRSMPAVQQAMQFAKSGTIGKILVSRSFCYKARPSIGKTDGPQPVPATVDYALWCGPAPLDPPRRKQFHYDWHWFWETGNGDIGNQGAHQMDLARWALDKPALAPSVISVGGRFGYDDDGQTPNTLMTVHDYGDCLLIGEVRGLPAKTGAKQVDQFKGIAIGNVIECEGGYVSIAQRACAAYDKNGTLIQQFSSNGVQEESAHKENFLEVVRSRKREDQRCELAEGFVSSCVSHVANISYQLGQKADPDAIQAAMKQPAAAETLARFQSHLAANDIKLDIDKATLGMPLKVDPAAMKFMDNDAANAMLTRTYRDPFVVTAV
ncbi:MAG: Gfo/Idh/MocA family oxidoreductase [Tepidisphaeraceae bacterium]